MYEVHPGSMAPDSSRDGDTSDTSRLCADLADTFPELAPIAPMRVIGRGVRSLAIVTAGGVVLRVGQHPDAQVGVEREFRLLPLLADRLPVAVPLPRWRSGSSDRFPYGVLGYDTLMGVSLRPEMLAFAGISAITRQVGGFLHALHDVPIELARSAGIPDASAWRDELAVQRDAIVPALGNHFSADERAIIERWWAAFLVDLRTTLFRPTLCHGDLWYEHILLDEQSWIVTGILDFGGMRIADPALDIATQMHLGEPFTAAVLAAYHLASAPVDATFGQRVRRLWEHREFAGLYDALRLGDADELAGAVAKIRRGPVLTPIA